MKIKTSRTRGLLAALVLSGVTILGAHTWLGAESGEAPQVEPGQPRTLPPAENLRIRIVSTDSKGKLQLDSASDTWERATPTAILLSRTPRIFQTELVQDRRIPACQVRGLRANGQLYLRLQWDDPTRNAPAAPPARTGEGGDPKQLYKRPTGETVSFPDAAAVMVPERWTGPSFPSLLMGDKHTPARLYYWSASRGAEILSASGRATPQPTGQSFAHRARHANGRWTVTMEIPDQADGYPVAFALWDGQFGDRDGLKSFSIWYVLSRSA